MTLTGLEFPQLICLWLLINKTQEKERDFFLLLFLLKVSSIFILYWVFKSPKNVFTYFSLISLSHIIYSFGHYSKTYTKNYFKIYFLSFVFLFLVYKNIGSFYQFKNMYLYLVAANLFFLSNLSLDNEQAKPLFFGQSLFLFLSLHSFITLKNFVLMGQLIHLFYFTFLVIEKNVFNLKLSNNKPLFIKILNTANFGVILFDSSGNITFYNKTALHLVGKELMRSKFNVFGEKMNNVDPIAQLLDQNRDFERSFFIKNNSEVTSVILKASKLKIAKSEEFYGMITITPKSEEILQAA